MWLILLIEWAIIGIVFEIIDRLNACQKYRLQPNVIVSNKTKIRFDKFDAFAHCQFFFNIVLVHIQPCSALKAALINQVFLYVITDNKYALALYSGIFPPGHVTSMFDVIPAIIYEMDNIWFWVFFPIFFLIDDLWFYGYHRLVHAVPFLYKHVSNLPRNS